MSILPLKLIDEVRQNSLIHVMNSPSFFLYIAKINLTFYYKGIFKKQKHIFVEINQKSDWNNSLLYVFAA